MPCEHNACLFDKTQARAVGQGMTPITFSHDTWSLLVDAVAARAGRTLSVYEACCVYYNLCAPSVITRFSTEVWNLWRRLDGTKHCTYSDYWNLPALYVDACDIIESELAVIRAQVRLPKEITVKNILNRKH